MDDKKRENRDDTTTGPGIHKAERHRQARVEGQQGAGIVHTPVTLAPRPHGNRDALKKYLQAPPTIIHPPTHPPTDTHPPT